MPTHTKQYSEQDIAQLLVQIDAFLNTESGVKAIRDRLEALALKHEEIAKLDFAKIQQDIDRIRAKQEDVVRAIRSSRHPLHVPGIDEKQFSLCRALVGVANGNTQRSFEAIGAGYEWEVMSEARRKQEAFLATVKDAMSAANTVSAGAFIPDQVVADVIAAVYTASAFINLSGEGTQSVSTLDGLVGGNVKIPKFDGGVIAYFLGEEEQYAESMATVGDVTMNPKKCGVLVKLTDAMRRFAGFGFDNLLRQDMTRALAKKIDWAVAFGNGGENVPRGILNTPDVWVYRGETGTAFKNITGAPGSNWNGTQVSFDHLDNMLLTLEEDDIQLNSSARWVSGPRTFRYLRQLKVQQYSGQTAQMSYVLGTPIISEAKLVDAIGPFSKSTQFALHRPGALISTSLAAGSGGGTEVKVQTIFGGNLGEVVFGRWSGIEVSDDGGKGAGFIRDHTYMKMLTYLDVAVRQPRAVIFSDDLKPMA